MGDDLGGEDEERLVELSSIVAIYPEIVLDADKPFEARLDLQVVPTHPVKICFATLADGAPPDPPSQPAPTIENAATDSATEDVHLLTYLPPLSVQIQLPDGYPTEKPPVLNISTSPAWLPKQKVETLTKDCTSLWEEYGRDQVLFACLDHLQQQTDTAFGMTALDSSSLIVSKELKIALLDFDIKSKREAFERGTFDCGICLEPKKGSSCHRLLRCFHVFCISCLQDFYNNCISEGDVDNVKCLDPTCGKELHEAIENQADPALLRKRKRKDPSLNPSELLQIPLEPEVVQRYVHLKRKKKLESDLTTVYCPRQWCQGAAISKKHPKTVDLVTDNGNDEEASDSEQEILEKPRQKIKKKKDSEDTLPPMSERLRICEDCSYAFCCVCKKGWHGELMVCNPRKQAELNAEEKASEDYLKLHTTACPTCAAPSQKTMGCNHMICFKCKTHFCYLCSSYLMEENPYAHFNDHKSTCYMRLWELEGGDGDQNDHRFHGDIENWIDEETDDEEQEDDDVGDDDDDDVISVHSDGTDDLFYRPNWFFNPNQAVQHGEDDDSEDDIWPGLAQQPANPEPDPRQAPQIEIINFARAGVRNPQYIAHPGQANGPAADNGNEAEPAPLLRIAPARINEIRPRHRDRLRPIQPDNMYAGDLGNEIEAERNHPGERIERVAAAPGQGNEAALQPAPVRAMGLERFLQLARDNREDEWDSDELEGDQMENDAGFDNW